MLLRAGRVPLSGQIMALEPLGPSAATLEVARDEERDRGDIPLAVGASLLLVLLLAAANRKNRELVPPAGPLTQEEKEQGHPVEKEAASLRQM